jgi:Arc/MetJ family transcription regulator
MRFDLAFELDEDTGYLHAIVNRAIVNLSAFAVLCKLLCKETHMATNLAIDPDLLDRALEVSGEQTKKATVTKALEEFIARRQQRRVLELMGKLEWDTSFDHKAERSRK